MSLKSCKKYTKKLLPKTGWKYTLFSILLIFVKFILLKTFLNTFFNFLNGFEISMKVCTFWKLWGQTRTEHWTWPLHCIQGKILWVDSQKGGLGRCHRKFHELFWIQAPITTPAPRTPPPPPAPLPPPVYTAPFPALSHKCLLPSSNNSKVRGWRGSTCDRDAPVAEQQPVRSSHISQQPVRSSH